MSKADSEDRPPSERIVVFKNKPGQQSLPKKDEPLCHVHVSEDGSTLTFQSDEDGAKPVDLTRYGVEIPTPLDVYGLSQLVAQVLRTCPDLLPCRQAMELAAIRNDRGFVVGRLMRMLNDPHETDWSKPMSNVMAQSVRRIDLRRLSPNK